MLWRPGLEQWEPLDQLLTRDGLISLPPAGFAAPAQKKGGRTAIIVGVIAAALLLVVCAGVLVWKLGVREARKHLAQFESGAVGRSGRAVRTDAMTAATRPVQWTSNSLTYAEVRAQDRALRERMYLRGYLENGERNPATDVQALGLLTNWISFHFGGPCDTNLPPIEELGDALAANPACTDPLILTITAIHVVELHEAIRRLERAVAAFPKSRHGHYPRLYATVVLASKLIQDKADREPVLDAEAVQHLREVLREGLSPAEQESLAVTLMDGWGRAFFKRNGAAVCAVVTDAGQSYKWLAEVLQGEAEINEAWRQRGGGYADTVSQAGWAAFAKHLEAAGEHLTRAWELRPESPIAAGQMMQVSLGRGSLGDMRLWFDRATAAQFDYAPAWSNLRWGLRPRWYGDLQSMLAFGETALNTGRFDTDVPRIFFDAVTDLESELKLPKGEHLYGREDIWPNLQKLYEGYLAAETNRMTQDGWRNTYATVAYLAGRLDVARDQLAALNWTTREWNLAGWGRDLSLMPLEVAARTGPLKDQIQEAEAALQIGETTRALKLFAALAAGPTEDERTRRFITIRLAALRLRSGYEAGEWVSLLPADESLTDWRVIRGECRRLPDGSLEVKSGQVGHMLQARMETGREFEVRGSFSVVSSSTRAFQAGLVMGLPDWESATWYGFRVKRNDDEGDVAAFGDGWSKKQLLSRAEVRAGTNAFTFRFASGKVSASVNGADLLREVAPPKNSRIPTNEFHLGLGAFNDMNETVIRYHELKVRKLTGP